MQTTIPEIINIGASLVLFGFNNFKLNPSIISFYIHFVPIRHYVYSTLMKIRLIINYNERIRILEEEEEKEIECQLQNTYNKDLTSYFCETEIKNSNIR